MEKILTIPWSILIVACLTLGLAPYNPPHLFEKIQLLISGRLVRPLDIFDLFLHALPWLFLVFKAIYSVNK